MLEKSVPSVTIKLYPLTVVGVMLLSVLTLGSWGLWWFQVYPPGWRSDASESLDPPFAIPDPLASPADPLVWSPAVVDPSASETSSIQTSPGTTGNTLRDTETTPVASELAVLRVGNQTPHPVRIALLQRSASTTGSLQPKAVTDTEKPIVVTSPTPSLKGSAKDPVHWDFEPGEGGYQGLILSLPQGDLKLEAGDILVAFAQDGSRRYWGPYVVGETSLPHWNTERSEWQLLLQP